MLTLGALASLSGCSVADPSPVTARDGSTNATSASGGAGTVVNDTNASTTSGGSGVGGNLAAAAGGASSAGGADTGGGGAPSVEPEPPPVCLLPQYTHVSAFGSIFDGWWVGTNSAFSLTADADGGTMVVLDPTDGSPASGSVKLTIPFSDVNQQVLFAQSWPTGINLRGTTVTARIKLDSGLNTSPEHAGQAYLVVKSTSAYLYAPAAAINLDSSAGWVTLTLDADSPLAALPVGYNACDIREIDVIIQTADMGTYTKAVVHIDTITVASRVSGADAATDAAN
jgi:hypothetical protein